jgi:hypothetical protein
MSRRHLTAFLVALAVALTLAAAGQAEAANVRHDSGGFNSTAGEDPAANNKTWAAHPEAYHHQIFFVSAPSMANATAGNFTVQGRPVGADHSAWANATTALNGTNSAPQSVSFDGYFEEIRLYAPNTGVHGSWYYTGGEL